MQLAENSHLSRYEWIPSIMAPLLASGPSKLVLDIGAGDARMRQAVENAGGSYRPFDLFPANQQVERWDLDEPPADSWPKAGAAILMDVIEHCNNPGLALRHIAAALSPEGFLALTMPNPRWSRSRMYALKMGTPICFTQSDLDLNHHVFTPWPHIMESLLADAGFQVERYVTLDGKTSWPGAPFGWRYPVRWGLASAMKAIEHRDPTACGMSYGLVARKAGRTMRISVFLKPRRPVPLAGADATR